MGNKQNEKKKKRMCKKYAKHMHEVLRTRKLANNYERTEPAIENNSERSILTNLTNVIDTIPAADMGPKTAIKCKSTLASFTVINQNVAGLVTEQSSTSETSKSDFETSTSRGPKLEERRIVDLLHFFEQLKKIANHSPAFGCGLQNLEIVGEKRMGLISSFTLKCNMCNTSHHLKTSDPNPTQHLNINTSVVASAMTTGTGFSQLDEIFSSINVPFMSQRTFDKINCSVCEGWERTAAANMEVAAARERKAAIDEGRFSKDGIPIIDVIADGCWSKRSYRTNYSALSGAAAIVGKRFGEVIYLGVKNKYCCVCARAENKGITPAEHKCFKNYSGPSTNMESEILMEGFKNSISMYGLIFGRMIADGDSSAYSKILDSRPYLNYTVEKIECRNHLLRNMCNKLQGLNKEKKYLLEHRKMLTTQRILAIRKVICLSIKYLKNSIDNHSKKVNDLYVAISNAYYHAFGNHTNCESFYCQSAKTSEDLTVKLKDSALAVRIKYIIGYVAGNARSLIEDVDSNRCEQFNSIIAKYVGGKRINFSLKQSYQARCAAAVVSFNTKRPLYNFEKSLLGNSPKSRGKNVELKRIKKNEINKKCVRRKRLFVDKSNVSQDKNYGESCEKPDLPEEDFERLKITFLKDLQKTDQEIADIERATVLQGESSEWLEIRRKLLTASVFGRNINKRITTCASIVKNLLYKTDISNVKAIKHGREYEKIALIQLAEQEKIKINRCGLFIDKTLPFLGATPDGIIDENRLVEVKCPLSAFRMTLEDAVKKKKITFWKYVNGELVVNRKHNWYLQVQGQLHITGRQECIFAVWTGQDKPIKIELIKRDDKLWEDIMAPRLQEFYLKAILPELIDPRHSRNMPIRTYLPSVSKNTKARKRKQNTIQTLEFLETNVIRKSSRTEEIPVEFQDF